MNRLQLMTGILAVALCGCMAPTRIGLAQVGKTAGVQSPLPVRVGILSARNLEPGGELPKHIGFIDPICDTIEPQIGKQPYLDLMNQQIASRLSSSFTDVRLMGCRDTQYPGIDYTVQMTMTRYVGKNIVFTWGLTPFGAVLALAGFPAEQRSYEMSWEWRLYDAQTNRELLSHPVVLDAKLPLNGLPPFAWLYGRPQVDVKDPSEAIAERFNEEADKFAQECVKVISAENDEARLAARNARRRQILGMHLAGAAAMPAFYMAPVSESTIEVDAIAWPPRAEVE